MASEGTTGLSLKTDEDLLEMMVDGASEAFDLLFERYKVRIFSFIRGYVKDAETSEDIFQKTFIRLYTKARFFKKESRFSTWLYTIAANLSKDELKRRSVRKHIPIDSGKKSEETASPAIPAERLSGAGPDPRAHADEKEVTAIVREAVEELPDDFRMVAIMHGLQRLKYREIAEILGVPVGTVQSRMHGAIVRLREKLSHLEQGRK